MIIMSRKSSCNNYIVHNYQYIEVLVISMQINTEKNQREIKNHGNYSFPVCISPESIESYERGTFMWHWHTEIELTWIISGQIEYLVNDKRYILSEGQGLFANSNALHAGYMIDDRKCRYLSVTFHPRFIYGYKNSLLQTKYVNFITENESWDSLHLSPDTEWQASVIEKIQEIYRLSQSPPQDFEMQVHLILCSIWQQFYQYYHALPAASHSSVKYVSRLKEIITYLQEHASQEVSLDDVAAHVNISKSECCRFFKKHMKLTIFEYLMYLRIQNSLPLLLSGESITKTAGMAGFSTPAYYGQIFRRYMGCSPSQYRQDNQKNPDSFS